MFPQLEREIINRLKFLNFLDKKKKYFPQN